MMGSDAMTEFREFSLCHAMNNFKDYSTNRRDDLRGPVPLTIFLKMNLTWDLMDYCIFPTIIFSWVIFEKSCTKSMHFPFIFKDNAGENFQLICNRAKF